MADTHPSPDATALYRDALTAIREALDIPVATLDDFGAEQLLTARRALVAHSAACAVLAYTDPEIIAREIECLRQRTAEMPATYHRQNQVARDLPTDCVVCGPGCCAPVLGIHTSCPGPAAGTRVVSA